MSWYNALADSRSSLSASYTLPQELADGWTSVMAEACRWFHDREWRMEPSWEHLENLPDGEVESRVVGYQVGYDKEYNRRARIGDWSDYYGLGSRYAEQPEKYDFTSFPLSLKRTICSRWDALHYAWLKKTGARYDPEFGYYWLIEGVKVKYIYTDEEKCPTENDAPPFDNVAAQIAAEYESGFLD